MFVFVLHPWLKEDDRRGCSTSCWKGLTMVNSWTFLGCSGVQFSQPLCLLRRHTSFSRFLIWPTSQPKCICQLIKSIGGNCSNENSWYTCHGLPPYPKHYATSMHVKHLGHRQQNRTPLTLPKIGKKRPCLNWNTFNKGWPRLCLCHGSCADGWRSHMVVAWRSNDRFLFVWWPWKS